MATGSAAFAVKPLLDGLRDRYGDSDFGYRMQALLAHVLLGLGGRILEINARGHPDVRAILGDRELLVQVKTSAHRFASSLFEMAQKDAVGIEEPGRRYGILAFLDCAEPIRWIVVPAERATHLVGRPVHVAGLASESDQAMSADFTEEFFDTVLRNSTKLHLLTYSILASRALRGERI